MESLFQFIVRRRHLIVFLALALIAGGIVAYQKVALEAYPDIANMQVRVITKVDGKAAQEVEKLVTIPLERVLNGIPHSLPPRSVSLFGLSSITIVFDSETDPITARQQVLERIQSAELPEGVDPQMDPNASPVGEVFRYFVRGDKWSSMARKEQQDWSLNRQFRAVDGIVESTGFGGPTKIYQVSFDPERLNALGVSQSDLAAAISQANGTTGGSYIVSNDINYMVRGEGLLKDAEDIGAVVVSTRSDGIPIRVKDVASVSVAAGIRQGQVGVNDDDDAVEGILLMRRGENPSRAVDNLKEAWPEIAQSLPEGMELVPLYDRTALVHNTVDTIGHNVAEGVVLVVVILMLFLFQVRSSLIVATVIPVALLTAFILLNLFKVPANLLSLGAIDFGIIVDGAIILMEHVAVSLADLRDVDERPSHKKILDTIAKSSAEIAKPILFSTAIIMITFLPVLSFDHVEGKLFRPLAIMMNFTLCGAILAAIFLVPALCAFIYTRGKLPSHKENPLIKPLHGVYERTLKLSLRKPLVAVAAAAALCGVSLLTVPFLGSEFIPELEEGNIWLSVSILPTSVSLDHSVEIARELRAIARSYPEVTNVVSHIGSPDDGTDPFGYNFIQFLIDLEPQAKWRPQFHSKDELIEAMNRQMKETRPGLVLNFSQYIKDNMDEAISGVRNGEYAIKIYGPDVNVLEDLSASVSNAVKKVRGTCDVARDHLVGQPQVAVRIDFEKAARYGVHAKDVLDVVEIAIGGKSITKVIDGDRRFDVVMRLDKEYRNTPTSIGNILINTPAGTRIPLAQIADIHEEAGAATICRENNKRRTAVYCNIRGRDLGSTVMDSQKAVTREVKLPPGYSIQHAGQFDRAIEAGKRLSIVVPITLLLIFFLLYGAFGEAKTALVAMSVVPVAVACGLLILFVSGTHMSVSSGVGFVALFGLCIQNSVVLTARMKELTKKGYAAGEAAFEGAMEKMNAVLTASTVAVIGLVPAAIATGIGSQSQKPFATVISGGLLPATILLLITVPCIYMLAFNKKPNNDALPAESLGVGQRTGS